MNANVKALRKLALGYPGTEEGVACEGTALEKRTVKARGKAFVFLGVSEVLLKLGPSLPAAAALAAAHPEEFKAGANGWVRAAAGDDATSLRRLAKWLDESYRLVAGGAKPRAKASRASPRRAAPRLSSARRA